MASASRSRRTRVRTGFVNIGSPDTMAAAGWRSKVESARRSP
jgi:hypothetical protein